MTHLSDLDLRPRSLTLKLDFNSFNASELCCPVTGLICHYILNQPHYNVPLLHGFQYNMACHGFQIDYYAIICL